MALLSLRSGVPVVPILIEGSRRLLPLGSYWPRRSRVRLNFLPPVAPPPLLAGARIKNQVEEFRAQLEAVWWKAYQGSEGPSEGEAAPQETCRKLQ